MGEGGGQVKFYSYEKRGGGRFEPCIRGGGGGCHEKFGGSFCNVA